MSEPSSNCTEASAHEEALLKPALAAERPGGGAFEAADFALRVPGFTQPRFGHEDDIALEPAACEAPEALANEMLAHWGRHDDAALLLAAWPQWQHRLDAMPLAQRNGASRCFAETVLDASCTFPREFIALLAAHFNWGQDFRVDQALGLQLAHRLREMLAQDWIVPIRDPQVLAHFADLFTLDRLLAAAPRWRLKAWSFAALAHPRLGQSGHAPPAMLRALGIELVALPGLRKAIKAAALFRTAAVVLMAFAFATVLAESASSGSFAREQDLPWLVRAALMGLLVAAGFVALLMVDQIVAALQGRAAAGNAWRRWFDRHRDSLLLHAAGTLAFFLAVALGLASGSLAEFHALGDQPQWLATWGLLIVAGTMAVWPRGKPWEHLMLPVGTLAALAGSEFLADRGGAFTGIAAAGLWLALCQMALVYRSDAVLEFYRRPWAVLQPRAWWGWLILLATIKAIGAVAAIAFVATLPLSFMVFAVRFGFRLPLAAIAMVWVVTSSDHPAFDARWPLLPMAAAAALALVLLQKAATRLTRLPWWRRERSGL